MSSEEDQMRGRDIRWSFLRSLVSFSNRGLATRAYADSLSLFTYDCFISNFSGLELSSVNNGFDCTITDAVKRRPPSRNYTDALESQMQKMELLLHQISPGIDYTDVIAPPIRPLEEHGDKIQPSTTGHSHLQTSPEAGTSRAASSPFEFPRSTDQLAIPSASSSRVGTRLTRDRSPLCTLSTDELTIALQSQTRRTSTPIDPIQEDALPPSSYRWTIRSLFGTGLSTRTTRAVGVLPTARDISGSRNYFSFNDFFFNEPRDELGEGMSSANQFQQQQLSGSQSFAATIDPEAQLLGVGGNQHFDDFSYNRASATLFEGQSNENREPNMVQEMQLSSSQVVPEGCFCHSCW